MAPIIVHAVYDGRAFVPSTPLNLPVGTTINGIVKPPVSQEEWLAFLDSVEGARGDYDFVEPEELPMDDVEPVD